ncbi:MAG: SpoIIE family protein phosphatase, partial [Lentisphaerae bacterium]|nr:SpoIIE family protein phosphatase [Lentisphaerota bacterium]
MTTSCFIEVDHYQVGKHSEPVSGDAFLSQKVGDRDRVISVLADGLGSGIKASVLATLTSSMALKFVSVDTDIEKTAGIMMDILPVCSERRIGYSTFTIVDIDSAGDTRIIEHDNPPFMLIRNGRLAEVRKTTIDLGCREGVPGERQLSSAHLRCRFGDRIVFFSDGVNQSGMGRPNMPLGWGTDEVGLFVTEEVGRNPHISARDLARRVVERAVANDEHASKDDTTCGVIYFRRPQRLLVVTGPPFSKRNDSLMASTLEGFQGRKAVCGGTTARIISRELKREVTLDLANVSGDIPPGSTMPGIDLVTEGTITLAKVAELLEQGRKPEDLP